VWACWNLIFHPNEEHNSNSRARLGDAGAQKAANWRATHTWQKKLEAAGRRIVWREKIFCLPAGDYVETRLLFSWRARLISCVEIIQRKPLGTFKSAHLIFLANAQGRLIKKERFLCSAARPQGRAQIKTARPRASAPSLHWYFAEHDSECWLSQCKYLTWAQRDARVLIVLTR